MQIKNYYFMVIMAGEGGIDYWQSVFSGSR